MESIYDKNKLTKEQKKCLSLVESLGIYELRALSRIFGGNSPTTQKRNDHIKHIMDKIISKEEIEPFQRKSGRPYKEIETIGNVLDELSHITGMDYTKKTVKQKKLTFNQIDEEIFSKNLFPIQAKGIVLKNENDDLYFVNEFNNTLVLVDKRFSNSVGEFDYIFGTAVVMNSEKEYILTELKEVNFANKHKSDAKEFSFNKKSYPLGFRYRFENMTKYADNEKLIKNLVDELKGKGIVSVAIVPNAVDEEKMTLQLIGFDCLISFDIAENAGTIYDTIYNTLEFLKKMKQQNKDICFFVQDPVTLANYVDYYFRNGVKCYMGHTEQVANFVREFSKLVKTENDNSLTIFSTCDTADMLDQLFVSVIYKNYKQI